MLVVRSCKDRSTKERGLFAVSHQQDQQEDLNNNVSITQSSIVFTEGSELFTEYPVDSEQLLFTRLCGPSCIICLKPVGTPIERIEKILQLSNTLHSLSQNELECLNGLLKRLETLGLFFPCISRHCIHCDSRTCSDRCFETLLTTTWHQVICTPQIAFVSPSLLKELRDLWRDFCSFSTHHYETFALAGRLCCHVMIETVGEKSSLSGDRYSYIYEAQNRLITYRSLVPKETWASCQAKRRRNPNLEDDLMRQCRGAYDRLLRASDKGILNRMLHESFQVQFDRVNAEISLEDPLAKALHIGSQQLWTQLEDCRPILIRLCAVLYPSRNWTTQNNSISDLIDNAFPDIMATSYCPKVGLLNHSCRPNVSIEFSWEKNLEEIKLGPICKVKALIPIRSGTELCIAYVDPDLQLNERHIRLKFEYDFVCTCTKCMSEVAIQLDTTDHLCQLVAGTTIEETIDFGVIKRD